MLHNCNYVVYDLETGGFTPDKNPIIEVAMIALDCNLKEINRYENFVKVYNDLEVTDGALMANGISWDQINSGIDYTQLIKDITKFLGDLKMPRKKPILVGHNIIKFDNPFLYYLFNLVKKDFGDLIEKGFTIDTLWLSRMRDGHHEVNDHKLGSACSRKGVELLNAHRAMSDVEGNAQLFIEYMRSLRDENSSNTVQPTSIREQFKFQL